MGQNVTVTPKMPQNVLPFRSGFLNHSTADIWGWMTVQGGASCAMYGVELHVWSPPTTCQEQPYTPNCVNQKCPLTLSGVHGGTESPLVENHAK